MNDIAIILISGLFVLLTIGVPFAFSLGIVTIIGLWMAWQYLILWLMKFRP